MMKFKIGDRVRVKMPDTNGNALYGTIINSNFLGIGATIKCDTPVDKRYMHTDSDEVSFLYKMLEKVDE